MTAAKTSYRRSIAAWLISVIATSMLMSVTQSTNVIIDLNDIGADISLPKALWFIARDLTVLGPIFFILVAIAFSVANQVVKLIKRNHLLVSMSISAAAIAVMLLAMQPIFETTLIAGARGLIGFTSITLCGAIGGFVFHIIKHKDTHV